MNNKLTTPKAILIGSFMIAGTILYTNGLNFSIIPEVKADVGGMDYMDLRRDRDFKKAVMYLVGSYGYQTRMDYRDLRRDRDFKKAVMYLVGSYGYQTSSGVESIVEDCRVYVDGDYGSISC